MKKIFLIGICLFCVTHVFAQKVLILENLSIGKSYKFFTGDVIGVRINDTTPKVSGKITEILDSSIIISNNHTFDVREITVVYKERRGIQIVSSSLLAFAGVFFVLDVFNNAINADRPVVRADVTLISSAVAAAGGVLQIFVTRKCEVGKDKWRLKIIDQIHVKE
ncbi:MAG TPA: hypothetical protein PKN48_01575 [Bacteroidales bacterium]|nr:hypothetical protein [Bacteroidales bacterium]